MKYEVLFQFQLISNLVLLLFQFQLISNLVLLLFQLQLISNLVLPPFHLQLISNLVLLLFLFQLNPVLQYLFQLLSSPVLKILQNSLTWKLNVYLLRSHEQELFKIIKKSFSFKTFMEPLTCKNSCMKSEVIILLEI